MFRLFKKKYTPSPVYTRPTPLFEPIEITVTDCTLVMRFTDGTRRKEFKAVATYCPPIATQERGIYTSDTNEIAKNFMSWFARDGVGVVGDEVLRFDRFISATLECTDRTVSVRVPVV